MNCLICSEEVKHDFSILNCNCPHVYHIKCINKWLNINNSCPHCRLKWRKNPYTIIKVEKKRDRVRRGAITPQHAEEIRHRIFLESIGINSSQLTNYQNLL